MQVGQNLPAALDHLPLLRVHLNRFCSIPVHADSENQAVLLVVVLHCEDAVMQLFSFNLEIPYVLQRCYGYVPSDGMEGQQCAAALDVLLIMLHGFLVLLLQPVILPLAGNAFCKGFMLLKEIRRSDIVSVEDVLAVLL